MVASFSLGRIVANKMLFWESLRTSGSDYFLTFVSTSRGSKKWRTYIKGAPFNGTPQAIAPKLPPLLPGKFYLLAGTSRYVSGQSRHKFLHLIKLACSFSIDTLVVSFISRCDKVIAGYDITCSDDRSWRPSIVTRSKTKTMVKWQYALRSLHDLGHGYVEYYRLVMCQRTSNYHLHSQRFSGCHISLVVLLVLWIRLAKFPAANPP